VAGSGTQTAALSFGAGPANVTESWNGSSWTTLPATLNTARNYLAGCGTQTASLGFGGNPVSAATESWNGSTWTSVNSLNTARTKFREMVLVYRTLAVAFGQGGNLNS
jgi:hypothetical protein